MVLTKIGKSDRLELMASIILSNLQERSALGLLLNEVKRLHINVLRPRFYCRAESAHGQYYLLRIFTSFLVKNYGFKRFVQYFGF